MPAPRASRRILLGSGLAATAAAATGLAGCTPDPTVRGRDTGPAPASASATPDADLVALAQAEQQLADWLTGIAATAPGAATAAVRALAAAHQAHADLLRQPDPLRPEASPAAGVTPGSAGSSAADWKQATAELARREGSLLALHRGHAMAATDPSRVLLSASLASFAAGSRSLGPPTTAGTVRPAEVEVGSRDDALLVLLSRLRALVQGLEVGAGQVAAASAHRERGRSRLLAVWALRDEVMAELEAGGKPVPPAELAYAMPGGFGDEASVLKTWAALEKAVLAGWGRVAAASTGKERGSALDAMVAQTAAVRANGAALDRWPGWV